jgi:serine/threonine protein kinase
LFHEISIMAQIDHPFILRLNGVSQDKRLVYMFTEYMMCGDLMATVNKFTKLSTSHARFYAAQVIACFEYMHERDFIYRDLKPENVLLAANGYIKLADFGFVKKLPKWERTMTFCGTPEYMAPEIVQNKGYGHAVDWYAVGIFLYELLYGRPPFMAHDPYQIFEMILH